MTLIVSLRASRQSLLSQQNVGQRLQSPFPRHRLLEFSFWPIRKIKIFQHSIVGTLFNLNSECRGQLPLLGNRFQDRVLSSRQFTCSGQHVFDGSQLAFVESSRGFFAIAGDKGNCIAFFQQSDGTFDLARRNFEFSSDAAGKNRRAQNIKSNVSRPELADCSFVLSTPCKWAGK